VATARPSAKRRVGKPGFDGSLHNYCANFTNSALTDELTRILSEKLDCDIYEDGNRQCYLSIFRPYVNQAEGLLYKINLYEDFPEFVIWQKDIPDSLARVLLDLDYFTMNKIITEAVRRLFESVDLDYLHTNSIYRKVKWRFGKEEEEK